MWRAPFTFLLLLLAASAPIWAQTAYTAAASEPCLALTWNAVTGALTYDLYRGNTSGGPYPTHVGVGLAVTNYLDCSLSSTTTYYYVVTASSSTVTSANSAELAMTMPFYDSAASVENSAAGASDILTTSASGAARAGYSASRGESFSFSASLQDSLSGGVIFESWDDSFAFSDGMASAAHYQAGHADSFAFFDAAGLIGQPVFSRGRPPQIYFFNNYGVAAAGSCDFKLTLTGSHFTALSTVNWRGIPHPANYISAEVLTVLLGWTDVAMPGPVVVTVTDAGGQVSAPRIFTVVGAPAVAASRLVGSVLVVEGRNFIPDTTVFWNGQALTTSWISNTRLQALLPAGIRAIGANAVTVANTGCIEPL